MAVGAGKHRFERHVGTGALGREMQQRFQPSIPLEQGEAVDQRSAAQYLAELFDGGMRDGRSARVGAVSRCHWRRVHVYLLEQRIQRAREPMRHTRFSLYDIAVTVVFSTQAQVCAVFKRRTGTAFPPWRDDALADAA